MSRADFLALYRERGSTAYTGEPVTQLEHALQAAALARQENAAAELIVAALLHDVGHLLSPLDDATSRGIDTRHESIGSRYLQRWFPSGVTEPIRLHVAAKRYLARDSAYLSRLSAESQRSLVLQGGAMTDGEAGEFEKERYGADSLKLRHWDDAAKLIDHRVAGLSSYQPLIEEVRTS